MKGRKLKMKIKINIININDFPENSIAKIIYKLALQAKNNAYAPYSNFKVGCIVRTKEKLNFSGCNIENASYGLTVCAERVAITKAVSEGYKDFVSLTIVTDADDIVWPCGACRQFIAEFGLDINIISFNKNGDFEIKSIKELLPSSFTLEREK